MSLEAVTHPAKKSSLNSRGVLKVRPCARSVQVMLSAYCLVMASKSRWLKASWPAR